MNTIKGTLTFWNSSVIIMKEMADIPRDPNFERFGLSEYTIALVDEVFEISERTIDVLFYACAGELTRPLRYPECCSLHFKLIMTHIKTPG